MTRDVNYTLLVDGLPKRLNMDLRTLQNIATEYMVGTNVLTIRCPHSGGSGAQAALLAFDKATKTWVKSKQTA